MRRIKLIINTTVFIFIIIYSISGCIEKKAPLYNHQENIEKYMELLKNEPDNCLYTEQIAGSYQALNNFEQAINFYEKTLNKCPNNLLNLFQLGVCHYLIMDREVGISYMDKAISKALEVGEVDMANMFRKEKQDWLEKWDLVKDMEWNKNIKREILGVEKKEK